MIVIILGGSPVVQDRSRSTASMTISSTWAFVCVWTERKVVRNAPESVLPVLLMELMDSSLTRFLEQPEEPLPFHTQVDICHDIALALAYLHSYGIIHRDLSSNNVLLIGPGNRAKVTDFGMSKLADANPHMTPMTMCPGTLAYMPPEALKDPPVYTNKLDSFSFGVLDIQILTRQFPNPSPQCKIMDPRFPTSTGQVKVPIPETERHQPHIDLVDPAHPLLPVALNCLKDRDRERPSAQELCNRLAALKDTPQYGESVQQNQRATTDGERVQIRELRAEAQERERQLQEKDRTIATNEAHLRQLNQQLEAIEQAAADFQQKHLESEKKIQDLEQHLVAKDQHIRELQEQTYDQPTAELQVRGQSARKGPLRYTGGSVGELQVRCQDHHVWWMATWLTLIITIPTMCIPMMCIPMTLKNRSGPPSLRVLAATAAWQ